MCITIRLPFVSRYSFRSVRVRGRWNTPYWKKGKDPHPQDKSQYLDFTKDPRPLYYKTPPCVIYHKKISVVRPFLVLSKDEIGPQSKTGRFLSKAETLGVLGIFSPFQPLVITLTINWLDLQVSLEQQPEGPFDPLSLFGSRGLRACNPGRAQKESVGCTPRGLMQPHALLRRALRRFSNSKWFLEGFLEGACRGFSAKTRFLGGFLEGMGFIEGA